MKHYYLIVCALLISFGATAQKLSKNKKAIIASVEKHEQALIEISNNIWGIG